MNTRPARPERKISGGSQLVKPSQRSRLLPNIMHMLKKCRENFLNSIEFPTKNEFCTNHGRLPHIDSKGLRLQKNDVTHYSKMKLYENRRKDSCRELLLKITKEALLERKCRRGRRIFAQRILRFPPCSGLDLPVHLLLSSQKSPALHAYQEALGAYTRLQGPSLISPR